MSYLGIQRGAGLDTRTPEYKRALENIEITYPGTLGVATSFQCKECGQSGWRMIHKAGCETARILREPTESPAAPPNPTETTQEAP